MKEFIDAISQVGFPIVISLLLLIRIEKKQDKFGEKMDNVADKLDTNTQAMSSLSQLIKDRIKR